MLTNIKFCGSLYIARLEVIEMKSYTVKEIAETLKTDPETVRRWIRSGKLDSTITSTKTGHIITEDALNKFIKDTPKYAAMVAGSIVTSPVALSLVVGGLIGGLVGTVMSNDKKKLSKEDVRKSIERQISDCEKRISNNKKTLNEIKSKIDDDEKSLQQFKYALEHLDLELIANEINKEK